MLDVFAVKGGAKKGCLLARLHAALPGLLLLKPFIMCLSETPPKNPKVKQRLQQWLRRHIAIQQAITASPLLVSSDIIESLFGNFKHVIARRPQADMNRTALFIPALCGNLGRMTVTQALNQTRPIKIWRFGSKPTFPIPYIRNAALFSEKNSQR